MAIISHLPQRNTYKLGRWLGRVAIISHLPWHREKHLYAREGVGPCSHHLTPATAQRETPIRWGRVAIISHLPQGTAHVIKGKTSIVTYCHKG